MHNCFRAGGREGGREMDEGDIPRGLLTSLLILNDSVTAHQHSYSNGTNVFVFVNKYAEGRRKTEGERVDWRGYKKSIGQRRSNEVKRSQQVPISVHKRQ